MTTNITNLRKAGRLGEAYKLAEQNLQANPTEIWNIRNMAWVLYDYAKCKATVGTKAQFLRCLEKIISLNVPADEDMFHCSVVCVVRSMASAFMRVEKFDTAFFDSLFDCIKRLKTQPRSPAYSSIMLTMLHTKNWWKGFGAFCRWWGWDNFLPCDYEPTLTQNDQKVMPLAERAFMAYARHLCDFGSPKEIEEFLPILERNFSEHLNFIYLPFYEAKLMLKMDRKEEFWNLMKSFVQKKSGEFWVWDLFGDASEDKQTRLNYYAKALTCKTKPEMSIKVREKTAFVLLELGYKAEALTELNNVVSIREKNKWSIPSPLSEAIAALNKDGIVPSFSNNAFFSKFANDAEKLILDRQSYPKEKQSLDFEGRITLNEKGFGFVRFGSRTIFVPQKLLSSKNIHNHDLVSGQYIPSFDQKKNKEGFAAISIKTIQ